MEAPGDGLLVPSNDGAEIFKWCINLLLTVPIVVAINKVDKPKVNVVCWFIFESFQNNVKGLNHLLIYYL